MRIEQLIQRRLIGLKKQHFKVLAFLSVLSLFSIISFAQSFQDENENDLDVTHRETAVSERIQSQLEQVLGSYYPKDSYLINVKAYLERIPKKQSVQNKQEQMTEDDDLPGLPIQPSQIPADQANQFTMDRWVFSDKFKIKYIYVSVLLDERVFTSKDIAFVNTVGRIRAGLDENRGDILTARSIPFPPPINASELYKETSVQGTASKQQQDQGQTKIQPHIYVVYAGVAFIILLLALVILLQIINIFKAKKALESPYGYQLPQGSMGQQQPYNLPNISFPQQQQNNIQSRVPDAPRAKENSVSSESKDIIYEFRQLMVTTLIGSPKLASDVFKQWVVEENDNGIYQIAGFLKATDPKLLDVLAEHLGGEITSKVEFAMNQMTSIDKESVIETLKKFREEFQTVQSVQGSRSGSQDMFEFLKQLTPEQIFHLIKDEPVGIMAIILAQVQPETANKIFKELNIEQQSKIPVEIGKLKKIPVSAYKEIADKLSKKAMEVKKIQYITTDGVDALGNILQKSTPEREQEIIASVALHDIQLADDLRKVYITFDELVRIPDKSFSEILRSFDREVMTKALIDASSELKDKFVSNLPQRLKIMITDEVKAFEESGEIPMDEIHNARRTITQKVRDMAKSGLIDLKKLTT